MAQPAARFWANCAVRGPWASLVCRGVRGAAAVRHISTARVASAADPPIPPCWPPNKRTTLSTGAEMAFVDASCVENGDESTQVVFLHGNPTSSFLWRNVMPPVVRRCAAGSSLRCVAPDLIGMGHSSKHPDPSSPTAYSFQDHADHLDEWFEAEVLAKLRPHSKVVLVLHDWGSALGFHWARRHADVVGAIVHMESVVAPMRWEEFPEGGRKIFGIMRTPEVGEEVVLEKNLFVERILPSSISRKLADEEMEEYRRPFAEAGEDRLPTLVWPRQIPFIEDGPQDVVDIVSDYNEWLSTSHVPKLYVHARPGFFADFIAKETAEWPNQQTIEVPGLHFVQEDLGGGHWRGDWGVCRPSFSDLGGVVGVALVVCHATARQTLATRQIARDDVR